MTNHQVSENVFSLPSTEGRAGQVFYGVMCAGVMLVPMLLFFFHHFIASVTPLNMKEFFWFFTIFYIAILFLCKTPARNAGVILRKHLGNKSSAEVTILAPTAANSSSPEIFALGRRYWFWQLISSYLTGVFFSWVGGIFFVFFI